MKISNSLLVTGLILGIGLLWPDFSQKTFANGPKSLELKIEPMKSIKIEKQTPLPETMPLDIKSPLEFSGLGPQPEPPDLPISKKGLMNAGEPRLINPRPEPPGDPRAGTPMPIPPSSPALASNPSNNGSVNPQHEPSSEGYFMSLYKGEASQYQEIPR
ncbi:hypothetical protein ACFL2O_03725 [Thermodesulfobacteriota bacterium]